MNLIVNALLAERGRHMDSLARLKAASTDWNAEDRARGEATMTNIMAQVLELDASSSATATTSPRCNKAVRHDMDPHPRRPQG